MSARFFRDFSLLGAENLAKPNAPPSGESFPRSADLVNYDGVSALAARLQNISAEERRGYYQDLGRA